MNAQDFINKYGLNVMGHLDLQDTAITALPDNLTVGGSLDLQDTAITALPDNIHDGSGVNLSGYHVIRQARH